MLHFDSDYMEGAHPAVMERLVKTNLESTPGYTEDSYCSQARDLIRKACTCPEAEVYFLVGGTQTNAIAVSAVLKPYEGVVAADTGHINQHEAGAIEATGHKVLGLPHTDGKLQADVLDRYMSGFLADESAGHMVCPGMVYISHPTEYGTLYSLSELRALSDVCRRYGLPLYMDGARLGYGLAAPDSDVNLEDIASLCDMFYIGGTKAGALFGEALVITAPVALRQMITHIKRQGALLAKGRLLGVQFGALFSDGLYLEISRHAIRMAGLLTDALKSKGYVFFTPPQTNQVFPVLDSGALARLRQNATFSIWQRLDQSHVVARFVTSWATREEDVRELIALL